MNKIFPIFMILLFVLSSCTTYNQKDWNEKYEIKNCEKVILHKDKDKAAQYVIDILKQQKLNITNHDMDYDDWIKAATQSAYEIYGVEQIGIYDKDGMEFVPYQDCTPKQKLFIDLYLLRHEMKIMHKIPTSGKLIDGSK